MIAPQTVLDSAQAGGLGEITILHPPGTFALTPASLISVLAVGKNRQLLSGTGLDWGSGSGVLAIAAAKVSAVRRVWGLEIVPANVEIARQNALLNGAGEKTAFFTSDSYIPVAEADRLQLQTLCGAVDFILSNPPSSEGDDGFGYRRMVLRGAREFLRPGGLVFLSVSYQYGPARVARLCEEIPGFHQVGMLASTHWVPFDLTRPDLLHCLELYAREELSGGFDYVFPRPGLLPDPGVDGDVFMNARAALAHYLKTKESPLTKWQTLLFRYIP